MKGSDGHERLGDQVVERPHVDPVQVDDAEAGLLDRVLLLAELRGVEHLDLVSAVGLLLEQRAEIFDRLDGRIPIRVDVGGAQGRLGPGCAAHKGRP